MNKNLSPVVIFTYNRLDHLKQTVDALRANDLAAQSPLYVISDGAKHAEHKAKIDELRQYVDGIDGFNEVIRVYRDKNLGAPASISQAEAQVLHDHGSIISMEDDNVSSRNFLKFMNDGLEAYRSDPTVFSVCGYCPPIDIPKEYDRAYWFYHWNLSWGYATWKDKHDKIYPLVNKYREFKQDGTLKALDAAGGLYINDSLRRDHQRQASFPDAVLCAKMTQAGFKSVIPTVSKIRNIGSDGSGVSGSRRADQNDVILDDGRIAEFDFGAPHPMNELLVAEAAKFYNGGLLTRLSRRLGIYHELAGIKRSITGL